MRIPFVKMEGLGNDFVVIDDLSPVRELRPEPTMVGVPPLTPDLAIRMCDRKTGIGADQLLWLRPPSDATHDAEMRIFNADGSTAEMCGNGIRAVGLYLSQRGARPGRELYTIETLAGVLSVMVKSRQSVTVDMGPPGLGAGFNRGGEATSGEKIDVRPAFQEAGLEAPFEEVEFWEVSMGNPHAVIFVPSLKQFPCEVLGPWLEKHPRFPKRTNLEFVEVQARDRVQVRVWERGAGFTLACGTGGCATGVAALANRKVQGEVTVVMPGGPLKISWFGPGESVMMEGPATWLGSGTFDSETGEILNSR